MTLRDTTGMSKNFSPSSIDPSIHQKKLKHTLRVRKLRKFFPFMALFSLGLITVWPEIAKIWEKYTSAYLNFGSALQAHNRLEGPQLHSIDDKGRPYHLKAKSALQKDSSNTDLEIPESTMELQDGSTLKVQAYKGFYNDQAKMLDYRQDVHLESSTGYHLKTSLAHVDFQKKTAYGDQNVEGDGPTGKIWSHGFKAYDNGVVHFTGKSRLIISKSKSDDLNPPAKEVKP